MNLLIEGLHTDSFQNLLTQVLVLLHGLSLLRIRIGDPNFGPLNLEVVLGLQDSLKLFVWLWHAVYFDRVQALGDAYY